MTNTKEIELEDYDFSDVQFTNTDPIQITHNPSAFYQILQKAKEKEIIADSDFISGLLEISTRLTNSHKLTSKKYYLWKLFALYLDESTDKIIQSIDEPTVKNLMIGFRFSQIGNTNPANYLNYELMAKVGDKSIDYDRYVRPSLIASESKTNYSKICSNLLSWDQNFRFSIRALKANATIESIHTAQIEIFEVIRKIIEELLSNRFAPNYITHADYNEIGSKKSRKFDLDLKFCELCWRLTLRSAAIRQHPKKLLRKYKELESKGISSIKKADSIIPLGRINLSNRYCQVHDPKNPGSKYRADLRYKNLFEAEVLALQFKKTEKSNFPITFKHMSGYEQDLRKAAYDLVHSKLLLNLGEKDITPRKSLAAQVLELKALGLRQSEIARKLNKSRQEISRANKKIDVLLKTRVNETLIHNDTEEAYSLLDGIKPHNDEALVRQTFELYNQGLNINQIAKHLGRFPHTVHAILFKSSKPESA